MQKAPERHGGSAGNEAPSQGMTTSAAACPDAFSACIAGDKNKTFLFVSNLVFVFVSNLIFACLMSKLPTVSHARAAMRQNHTVTFVTILLVCRCSEIGY